jgi:hypothetical protein
MTATAQVGLQQAATTLGVTIGDLRRALRTGRLPAVPNLTATSVLSADWIAQAEAAASSPATFSRAGTQKVPAFARFKGTSAWQKYKNRARQYAAHRAQGPGAQS